MTHQIGQTWVKFCLKISFFEVIYRHSNLKIHQKVGLLCPKKTGDAPGPLVVFFLRLAHTLLFFSFLFNFLSFPFSNFGFLILLSWLPSSIPLCPRACGPRVWRGALRTTSIFICKFLKKMNPNKSYENMKMFLPPSGMAGCPQKK